MKNVLIFTILWCMACLFIIAACNQTMDQQSLMIEPTDDVSVSYRSDCDICPEDDECCSGVWLQPGASAAFLQLCGTTNGLSACMGAATGNCPAFSGGGLVVNLQTDAPRQAFCVDEDSHFYVRNLSTSVTANIIITIQADLTSPDTMWLQIPPNDFRYFETNSACEMTLCE